MPSLCITLRKIEISRNSPRSDADRRTVSGTGQRSSNRLPPGTLEQTTRRKPQSSEPLSAPASARRAPPENRAQATPATARPAGHGHPPKPTLSSQNIPHPDRPFERGTFSGSQQQQRRGTPGNRRARAARRTDTEKEGTERTCQKRKNRTLPFWGWAEWVPGWRAA